MNLQVISQETPLILTLEGIQGGPYDLRGDHYDLRGDHYGIRGNHYGNIYETVS